MCKWKLLTSSQLSLDFTSFYLFYSPLVKWDAALDPKLPRLYLLAIKAPNTSSSDNIVQNTLKFTCLLSHVGVTYCAISQTFQIKVQVQVNTCFINRHSLLNFLTDQDNKEEEDDLIKKKTYGLQGLELKYKHSMTHLTLKHLKM